MAIAVNNVVNDVADSSPISYNVGASGSILVVTIGMAWESDNTITSITYNGTSMTRSGMYDDPNDWGRAELWYLVNPATGANNLVITSSDNSVAPLTVAYITGADVSDIGATAQARGESTSQSVSITPEASGSLLLGAFVLGGDGKTFSAVSGTTLHGTSGSYVRIAMASKLSTSTSAHTIQLTSSAGDGWAIFATEFKEATATTPSGVKTINGTAIASVKTVNGTAIASVKTING